MKKISMTVISLLMFMLLTNTVFAADGKSADKINIAVLSLESRGGLSQSEIGTLTDRLRSMLVRTHAFNVVDRGRMSEILDEQGFQMTGCTSTECAVEAGKILGVEQMVSGTIGRIGKMYTIDIILLDVTTSKILKSLTRDYTGEIEGLVAEMRSIAEELAGKMNANKKSNAYTLVVNTTPSGADVYVDQNLVGTTPLKYSVQKNKSISVVIHKKGYKAVKKDISMTKDQFIKMNLQQGSGVAATEYKESEKGGGSSTLWWILGGAAVVGGGAAYFLTQSPADDSGTSTTTEAFPEPPTRPQ